ncbi:helix-turn-helix domain-containing protein [Dactylosporangium vinaceum]|uniref:Helix-turn-helix domain-containing protein n=1 Tax=Dactylosporangium vinaceum TaxID=53362 RepID=A0ABV5MLF6_9ACTN|nr:helix-turn-helix domain-containing protein [Dactylosporangium vinaceum]UAB96981.1 helix-turn-helix domain-containing protein [Dactylosporangium vinaceum]
MGSTPSELLTTTEVAALLHCSRQHVVNLCDNGTLSFVRAGSHRRIRRDDVERLLRPPFRREVEKSLWLHRAVAGKLVADPQRGMALAYRNLAHRREVHSDGSAEVWFDAWERLLDKGVDAVVDMITARTEVAAELRQNTPFAGLLTERERLKVLAAFDATHPRAARSA